MSIKTDGRIMVDKTLENQVLYDRVSALRDAAAYGDGQLLDAAAMIIKELKTGRRMDYDRWPLEIDPPLVDSREQYIATAAAILIREIDRIRHVTRDGITPTLRSR